MSLVRNYITKFLMGLSAVAWTACGEDSGTSSADETSFTRKTFLNADSLIADAKGYKPTTDSCVTAQQYCETILNEYWSSGSEIADFIVDQRILDILDSSDSRKISLSFKRCLADIRENSYFMSHQGLDYGVSPCYDADYFFPDDSSNMMNSYPDILQKIQNAGACGDGVPNHVKVDSVYLNKEKENAEQYAKDFERSLNIHLDKIEEECE